MKQANTPIEKNSNQIEGWKIIAGVISTLILCFSAIMAASIQPFAGWVVSLLPTKEPVVTTTPFNTDVPVTNTPFIDFTPTVPSSCLSDQSCSPGQDWAYNCISKQWTIYPFQDILLDSNGCYQQPIWQFISTEGGGLYILAQHKNMISAKEYGIFSRLPQNTTVRLTMDLDVINNGEIWVGVFSEPDVKSNGLLIVVPPGKVKEHVFAVRTMPDQKRFNLTKIYFNDFGIYSIGFDLSMGYINTVIENTPGEKLAFSSAQRWLFIGYRAKLDMSNDRANIEALIKDLEITP
jgi:hypothetical protein